MSHSIHVEIPGTYHLVEQRVRGGRRRLMSFHDRLLTLAALHGSIYQYGMQLCGYNVLSNRVLLVVIPARPHAISLALLNADRTFLSRFDDIHRGVGPLWERNYRSCPFADEVAWSVLRYVDVGTVQHHRASLVDPHALSSAAEHAGLLMHGVLTAPPEKLPRPQTWQAFVKSPEDERFVQALEQCLRTGKPFGPYRFVHKVEQACGLRLRPACLGWPGLFDRR